MNISAVSSTAVYKDTLVKRIISKAGQYIFTPITDFCDITSKGSMKRFTFLTLAATMLLGARYFQARNDDERREVITRDFSTVATAVYAVPILKKYAGKYFSQKTGIPIAQGEGGFIKNLNPAKGIQMATTEQLAEWFSVKSKDEFKNIKDGLAGFCRNIDAIGGNLANCFKVLGHSEFANKNLDNEKVLEEIKAAKGEKLEQLEKLFVLQESGKEKTNSLLKKASQLKSVTEFGCIAATAVLLGWLLPAFNIWYTRKLYKDGDKKTEKMNQNVVAIPAPSFSKPLAISNTGMAEKFKKFKASGQVVV